MITQGLHRFEIICDTYYVKENQIEVLREQINKYIDWFYCGQKDMIHLDKLKQIEVREDNNKVRFIHADDEISDYDYVICEVDIKDIKDINFENEYYKKEFIDSIFSFIVFTLLKQYNDYIINELYLNNLRLKEE